MKKITRRELLKASPLVFLTGLLAVRPANALLMRAGIAPPTVTRNIANVYAPGYNATSPSTSSGSTVTSTTSHTNANKANVTNMALVLAGQYLTTAGSSPVGNAFPVSGTVQYPVGTNIGTFTLGGNTTMSVPSGAVITTDQIALSAPIPPGGIFAIALSSTTTSGLKYNAGLGLCGAVTTDLINNFPKQCLFICGDSIMTNNSGPVMIASWGVCGSTQMSIIGTQASAYASAPANFAFQVAVAQACGATMAVCDFSTNDIAAGYTASGVLANLQILRSQMATIGAKWTQTTLTPRTSVGSVTPTSITSSGNVMSVSVPNAGLFEVGWPYYVSGATQTEYNGEFMCTAVNTATNVVSLLFVGSSTPTATTTTSFNMATIKWSSHLLQTPNTGFEAGASSIKGQFNTAVRAGAFDSYIEWAGACETSLNSSIWVRGGDVSNLLAPFTASVKTGTPQTATRFQTTMSIPSSAMADGAVQFSSGLNVGILLGANGNGNFNGDYTSASAFPNIPQVGDAMWVIPGSISPTDDGLHPRANSGSTGGASLLNGASSAWLNAIV